MFSPQLRHLVETTLVFTKSIMRTYPGSGCSTTTAPFLINFALSVLEKVPGLTKNNVSFSLSIFSVIVVVY